MLRATRLKYGYVFIAGELEFLHLQIHLDIEMDLLWWLWIPSTVNILYLIQYFLNVSIRETSVEFIGTRSNDLLDSLQLDSIHIF